MNASTVVNEITAAKLSQAESNRYFAAQDPKVGRKLKSCGSWLWLREWIESGESRLMNANFCKKFLLCPACARRRAGRLILAYGPKVEKCMAESPVKLIPAMVTLTIKNGDDLEERIAHFKAAWKRMIQQKRRAESASSRNCEIEWNKVRGSIRSIEITNKGNGWHVHAHVFVLLASYIDQRKLSEEWKHFTGGDSFVVGVTECKNGVVEGLVECIKYAVKFSDMAAAQLWSVYSVSNGARWVDAQGWLRGVPEPDIDQEDTEGLEGPYRDFFALWSWENHRFTMTQIDGEAW